MAVLSLSGFTRKIIYTGLALVAVWMIWSYVSADDGEKSDDTIKKTGKYQIDKQLKLFLKAHGLSTREKQVLSLMFRGMQDKEIAGELKIAVSTVSNTLSRVYKKTNVSGRVGLMRKVTNLNP